MRTRSKAKGRRESGPFLPLPFSVLSSDNYTKLSAKGVKLLWDVASQVRMKEGGPCNNGDLCITTKTMSGRGWISRESLYLARDELLHYGFIQISRVRRYRSQCALYGLTFFAVNDCGGKLDIPSSTVPSNIWKESRPKWRRPRKGTKSKSLYRNYASVVPAGGPRPEGKPLLEVVG